MVETASREQTDPIIDLRGLTKRYGEHLAVNQLDLSVFRGEIFGLLGPNGAGKTTTILMMLGLTEPSGGTARVCGLNPVRDPLLIKRKVGYMPDDVGFYEDRSGLDNLLFTARLNRLPERLARERAAELLEKVGLSDVANKKAGTYSRGMRQRLGLADVLIKQPEVIILDEPTLGIDPEGVRELLQLISDLSRLGGLTVLLSSHHLHQVQQICDRVGLFVQGELIASGDIETLSRELDQEGILTLEMEVSGWDEKLAASIRAMEGIGEVQVREAGQPFGIHTVTIRSSQQTITPDIVQLLVQSGAQLHQLRQQQYGLDDIYHRFFQGGGQRHV
ncbi:ABC transporter ATP-binding protein [Paenibacillus sp. GCM10027626]|uniref:ABC transporter ATP-binding protein n=1 Tax=Paenibacillus sp. GCM10027626 TaxID=3273411 RepID=UPI0036379EF9